jgi:hypothetical protein
MVRCPSPMHFRHEGRGQSGRATATAADGGAAAVRVRHANIDKTRPTLRVTRSSVTARSPPARPATAARSADRLEVGAAPARQALPDLRQDLEPLQRQPHAAVGADAIAAGIDALQRGEHVVQRRTRTGGEHFGDVTVAVRIDRAQLLELLGSSWEGEGRLGLAITPAPAVLSSVPNQPLWLLGRKLRGSAHRPIERRSTPSPGSS